MSGRQGRSYYAVLGVQPGATAAEIRAAYHRLAMRWHPDKIASGRVDPALAEEAKGRFQQIHEAYQVLSDDKRRALYDAGMYDPLDDDQEEVEGFHDFLQEMVSLMATVGREEPVYSLGELQSMLDGMIQDFTSPQPPEPNRFFTGGFGKPASAEPRASPSQRMHSAQGLGDAACLNRTAFSRDQEKKEHMCINCTQTQGGKHKSIVNDPALGTHGAGEANDSTRIGNCFVGRDFLWRPSNQ